MKSNSYYKKLYTVIVVLLLIFLVSLVIQVNQAKVLSPSPITPAQPITYKTFANKQFHYSFQYPNTFTITPSKDGKIISVKALGEEEGVQFSIISLQEETRVLAKATSVNNALLHYQDVALKAVAANQLNQHENNLPGELSNATIEPIFINPNTGNYVKAWGIKISTGYYTDAYFHLQNNMVLDIGLPAAGWSQEWSESNTKDLYRLIDSLNPYI